MNGTEYKTVNFINLVLLELLIFFLKIYIDCVAFACAPINQSLRAPTKKKDNLLELGIYGGMRMNQEIFARQFGCGENRITI